MKNIQDIDTSYIEIPAWSKNLLNVLREHNIQTYQHSVDVSYLMLAIAEVLDLPETIRKYYYIAGLFHDIGKICIPNSILNSPDRLTPEDRVIIDYHTIYGVCLLSKFPSEIIQGIYYHHTPFSVVGMDNVIASPLHVVDVFDAIHEKRPYSQTVNVNVVLDYIEEHTGTEFSPYYFKALKQALSLYSLELEVLT